MTLWKESKAPRDQCVRCLRPQLACFCHSIQPIDPQMKIVLLTHWREWKKPIATGRMSALCLKDSELIPGQDYSEDPQVNALIADPNYHPVVLFPGPDSLALEAIPSEERQKIFPAGKRPLLFVIDGTWITAKKTIERSTNLRALPRICFQPERPSRFRVREQPAEYCLSTIEAIHQTLELLGDALGLDMRIRPHDHLLDVFDGMVEQQLVLAKQPRRYCYWSPGRRPRALSGTCIR